MSSRIWLITFGLLLVAFGAIWFLPTQAMAAGEGCDTLQSNFNAYGGNFANVADTFPKYCTAAELMRYLMNVVFSLIGGVTIVVMMVGGYRYITASGNQELADKGKQTLLWAAIGLAVIMMAAALVNIILNLVVKGKAF